jgi:hypothetical protein
MIVKFKFLIALRNRLPFMSQLNFQLDGTEKFNDIVTEEKQNPAKHQNFPTPQNQNTCQNCEKFLILHTFLSHNLLNPNRGRKLFLTLSLQLQQ